MNHTRSNYVIPRWQHSSSLSLPCLVFSPNDYRSALQAHLFALLVSSLDIEMPPTHACMLLILGVVFVCTHDTATAETVQTTLEMNGFHMLYLSVLIHQFYMVLSWKPGTISCWGSRCYLFLFFNVDQSFLKEQKIKSMDLISTDAFSFFIQYWPICHPLCPFSLTALCKNLKNNMDFPEHVTPYKAPSLFSVNMKVTHIPLPYLVSNQHSQINVHLFFLLVFIECWLCSGEAEIDFTCKTENVSGIVKKCWLSAVPVSRTISW